MDELDFNAEYSSPHVPAINNINFIYEIMTVLIPQKLGILFFRNQWGKESCCNSCLWLSVLTFDIKKTVFYL